MSEQSGEKTEQPTEKKLKDGRKKGQVAQSQDVNKLFVTAAGFEIVIALADHYMEKTNELIKLSSGSADKDFLVTLSTIAQESFFTWFSIILPILGAVIVARVLAGFCQYGFLFAPEALKIDMKKFSPVTNGKNLVSKKKFVEFFGNVVKAIILTLVVYLVVKNFLPEILLVSFSNLSISIDVGITVFSYILRISLGIFIAVAVTDFILQKAIFTKSMKMTLDEVYREYKQMEGDPYVKAERQALGREFASSEGGVLKQQVAQSDAVVVNPTHFAVALEYKPGKTPLPIVRCKGVDAKAKQIIQYAKKHDVPVIRYVTLARTLFHTGREGKFIPRPTLMSMAAVFRAIKEAELSDEKHPKVIAELFDAEH